MVSIKPKAQAKVQPKASDSSLMRPVESLELDPQNARKHGEIDISAIANSLTEFGQQTPIVITESGRVVKGNGTLMAAMKLGWKQVEVRVTKLTGAKLKAYAIADNRTAELSEWDSETLLASLQEIDVDGLLASTGFSDNDLSQMLCGEVDGPDIEPPAQSYQEQYGVIVICAGEAEQKTVYERLRGLSMNCKVVTT